MVLGYFDNYDFGFSMSGHAWSQSAPVWSIILRTLHSWYQFMARRINLFVSSYLLKTRCS